MNIIYAREPLPQKQTKAIFLAGPTPRDKSVHGWRPDTLALLQDFDGHVFVPEPRDGEWRAHYDEQVEWEEAALNQADVILFWIPRQVPEMIGLTTNDEWGRWKTLDPMKLVLGAPEAAPHTRYQRKWADSLRVPHFDTLPATVSAAVDKCGAGAERSGGACQVPLHIWRTPSFQGWYDAQTGAGNRLDGAKVLHTFRVGPTKQALFSYVLHVDVYVTPEQRNKTNEFIFGRPDISTIVGFYRDPLQSMHNGKTEVVLVQEFRSPAATFDGFIRELPGGSSPKPGQEPREIAAHEFEEETGIAIAPERFQFHDARQLAGTLSIHKAHLFTVELTEAEMAIAKKMDAENVTHGVAADTERTYVRVATLGEILERNAQVDWSMVGMIAAALL